MNKTLYLFRVGLRQISRDGMLFALLPAPVLLGLVLKLGVPLLPFSIQPWYGLADGVLICLTPALTGMISAFLLLEERDTGVAAFYQVTPAAGYSYLLARLGIQLTNKLLHIIPTHIFHRQVIALGIAGVAPHDGVPLHLCHFILADIKIFHRYLMSRFFLIDTITALFGGTPHCKSAALNRHHGEKLF